MQYRKSPTTGKIFTFETMKHYYMQTMPDEGFLSREFNTWEIVDVVYDSKLDTSMHIKRVAQLLSEAAIELLKRANVHDDSKLVSPEKEIFDEYTPKLSGVTYGSPEYKSFMDSMQVALKHHYANNSHHPEHYENGINGFNLFDLIEMFFDWKAASERHNDGNIMKSILINKDRFGMSEQLVDIFNNTAKHLGYNNG